MSGYSFLVFYAHAARILGSKFALSALYLRQRVKFHEIVLFAHIFTIIAGAQGF
jgi:hypothetical protein